MVEFVVGIIVGLILYFAFGERKKVSGTLLIDLSDPNADSPINLRFHEHIEDICVKKRVIFDVDFRGYDSQE